MFRISSLQGSLYNFQYIKVMFISQKYQPLKKKSWQHQVPKPSQKYLLSASKCHAKCRKYVLCSLHIEGPHSVNAMMSLTWKRNCIGVRRSALLEIPYLECIFGCHVGLQEGGYSKWIVSFLQVMCQCPSLEGADYVGWRERVETGEREIVQDGEECWVQTWKAFLQLWYCTIPEANIKVDDGPNKPILSGERSLPGWT